MSYTLTVKKLKNAFTLINSENVMHGIFATEKDALEAKPKIERNLENFYEHGRLVYLKRKRRRKRKFNRKARPRSKSSLLRA